MSGAGAAPTIKPRERHWIDRPQRGHNMLAHGSAVGVGGDRHCQLAKRGCNLDRALRREIEPGLNMLSPYGAV